MANQLQLLHLALRDLVEPLVRRLDGPDGLESLADRYGWRAPLSVTGVEPVRQAFSVHEALTDFLVVADELQARLDEDPAADVGASELDRLLEVSVALVTAVTELGHGVSDGLPDPYGLEDFRRSIADHVLDDLLEEYVRVHHPGFYLVLRVWGVIRYEPTTPSGPFRRPYTRVVVDWDRAVAAVEDPRATLQAAYHWGDPELPFDHRGAIDALGHVLRAVGLPTATVTPAIESAGGFPPEPVARVHRDAAALRTILRQGASDLDSTVYRIGLEVLPAAREGEPEPTGLLVRPLLAGGLAGDLPLGEHLRLTWAVAAEVGSLLGFAVFPDGADVVGGDPALGTRVELSSLPGATWFPLGSPRSSHVAVTGVTGSLTIAGTLDDPDVTFRVAAAGTAGEPGCTVVLSLADADAFVEEATGSQDVRVSFSPEITWSSRTGMAFGGMRTPAVTLPVDVRVGPFSVTHLTLAVSGGRDDGTATVSCRAGAVVAGGFGPVSLTLARLGIVCDVARPEPGDGGAARLDAAPALAGLGIDLRFAPPQGVQLVIDAGAVSGSGYLFHDASAGRYAGAVQLELDLLTLQAVGLVTTSLPGGRRGYSLLVIVSASNFTPVQLPFGFRLTGVGGLVGLNRAVDVDVLRAGLKAGSLDGALFPRDPTADVSRIVSALEHAMPVRQGRFLAGLMGRFEWGVPTVATIEVGLVLELPAPVRLLLLGQVTVLLPHRDHVLVRLRMDVLGVVDQDRGELAVDAVLHDSFVLSHVVTGDMALRSRWKGEATFLLAVGGFHPSFEPPAGFPSLARIAMTVSRGDSTRLRLEAYLAVTSNTVQTGARVDVLVRAAGFRVEGFLGFDALFQLSPFMFVVEIAGGVTLKWHGRTLMGVELHLTLSGPSPWHARGRATFKVWRFSKSISFDRVCGADEPPPSLPPADPLPALLEALSDPRSWGGELPAALRSVLVLREDRVGPGLLLHPLAELTVRQRVVPLGITIDRFGSTVPAHERRFDVQVVADGGGPAPDVRPLLEEFAPAQFLHMTDEAKLRRASFEPMQAGVAIGQGLRHGGDIDETLLGDAPIEYETVVPGAAAEGDIREKGRLEVDEPELRARLAVEQFRPSGRRTGSRAFAAPRLGVELARARYVVAATSDLARVELPGLSGDGAASYTAAAEVLWRHLEAQPAASGTLQVLTVFSAEGAVP